MSNLPIAPTIDEQGEVIDYWSHELLWRIDAAPEVHTAVINSTVEYKLASEQRDRNLDETDVSARTKALAQFDETGRTEHALLFGLSDKFEESRLEWIILFDQRSAPQAPVYETGVTTVGEALKWKWKHPGQHVVICRPYDVKINRTLGPRDLAATHLVYTQRVSNFTTAQRKNLAKAKGKRLPHPHEEIEALEQYIQTIELSERDRGLPADADKVAQYRAELARQRKYLDALESMFPGGYHNLRAPVTPVPALFVAKNGKEQRSLRVCISWSADVGIENGQVRQSAQVHLMDWTNVLDERLRGRYSAEGKTYEEAVSKVVAEWRENSSYYHPGNVIGELPSRGIVDPISKKKDAPIPFSFDTSSSFWDELKQFFETIGMFLGVIALAISALTPIPGAQIAAGLMWTSLFTSTAATVINIGRRKNNGFANDQEEIFDVLTIVGNVLSAGKLGWAKGAVIASKTLASQVRGALREFVTFGSATLEHVQTVLVVKSKADEFFDILNDPTLDPKERVDRLIDFAKDNAKNGAIQYINMKASDAVGRKATVMDEATRAQLMDPEARIDLDARKKQRADVSDGKAVSQAQDQPGRAPATKATKKDESSTEKSRTRGKTQFDNALPPHKRGMRAVDDFDFINAARELDCVIIVRDLNNAALDHVSNPFTAPKPVDMKAKTLPASPPPKLKNKKNAGLAAVHPDDPRLHDLLRDMKPPMKNREEYVRYLEKKGYTILGPENDYLIVSQAAPAGYFPDYDLHGVYNAKSGQDAYSETFRRELNARLKQGHETSGKDLVMHGPHDQWPEREFKEAGPNRGPKPPVTVYAPYKGKVKKFRLKTIAKMKAFYEAWGIPWERIYPEFEANGGKYID